MQLSIIPIGNSKGIRIPQSILKQLDIHEKVELEIHNKEIHIKPVNEKPRNGWKEAFKEMNKRDEDNLFIPEINDEEDFEWEWK